VTVQKKIVSSRACYPSLLQSKPVKMTKLTWPNIKAHLEDSAQNMPEIWTEFAKSSGGETKVYIALKELRRQKLVTLKEIWRAVVTDDYAVPENEEGPVSFVKAYFMPISATGLCSMARSAPNLLFFILNNDYECIGSVKEAFGPADDELFDLFKGYMQQYFKDAAGVIDPPDHEPLGAFLGLEEDDE